LRGLPLKGGWQHEKTSFANLGECITLAVTAAAGLELLCKVDRLPRLIVIRTPNMLAVVGVRRQLRT